VQAYVSALNNGKTWLLELMRVLSVHVGYLSKYKRFINILAEMEGELDEANEKFIELSSSTAYNLSTWNDSLREDFTGQFSQFRASLQEEFCFEKKFEILYKCVVDEVANYSMRRNKLIKPPYDRSKILTKYSQVDFTLNQDEMCRIEDISCLIKWRVISEEKNRSADVPSVCFVLTGPDSELVDMIDK